ncbi:MAG TPA: hypothetical protein VNA28_08675, partial [Solirubrobacteraceae bacterium]|nr:hypothetical protein [Solirubrobacteraceae bacterium]
MVAVNVFVQTADGGAVAACAAAAKSDAAATSAAGATRIAVINERRCVAVLVMSGAPFGRRWVGSAPVLDRRRQFDPPGELVSSPI